MPPMRSGSWLFVVAAVTAASGCGGSSERAPAPSALTATLSGGRELTVRTDPLALEIRDADGSLVLEAPAFVEIGLVDEVDATRYYDPAAPDDDIAFVSPAKAPTWDPATRALDLPLGDGRGAATLRVAQDGVLTLDADGAAGAVVLRYVLPLAGDDEIFGTGGREDSPGSRGYVREMQLRVDLASDSSTNEVHVPVPLAIYPARALAFFAEEHRPGAFDVGVAREDRMLLTFATTSLALHTLGGDAFEVLDAYTSITGRPRVPPFWAFAPMQWRNVHDGTAQVLEDAHAIRMHDIPGSTMWIDNPWQTGYNTLEFDPERFPGIEAALQEIDDLGFRMLVWSTPYLSRGGPTAADYAEAAEASYLVTDERGIPFDWPWQDGPGALIDFTRPGAIEWWRERIARVTDLGISGFKLDFAEDLVPELGGNRTPFQLAGGGTDVYHNYYAYGYHEAYLGALPDGDGFLLTRAGAFGTQQVTTCVWPGDLDNDFSEHTPTHVGGLPASVAYGLSLSASGFPFYGPDIGGFRNGAPTPESLIRWAEYAALGTVMQLGGGGDSHNPWDEALYGADALPIYRKYARLHMDLIPYLYTLAVRAGETGAPVNYAPGLVHPGHPYERAFFTGNALFVAPVVEEGATTRTVTLPPGDWIDWWTGEPVTGGQEVTVAAPLDHLPLWRRAGALIPMFEADLDTLEPATDPTIVSFSDPANRELRIVVTPADGEATFTLYESAFMSVNSDSSSLVVTARAGDVYDDFRWQIDLATEPSTADLAAVADETELTTCPAPGCWRYDQTTNVLHIRQLDVTAESVATFTR